MTQMKRLTALAIALIFVFCSFISVFATASDVSASHSKGDVNNNGEIDSQDYLLTKRAYFGTYKLDEGELYRADVNDNGDIDSTDYMLIKRMYFGTYPVPEDVHVGGSEYFSDAENHWNVCTCGEKMNISAHSGEWKTVKEATADAEGLKELRCTVCNYLMDSETIPATGEPVVPDDPSTPDEPVKESVTVDGDLSDSGWKSDGWVLGTPENSTWQDVPPTETLSFVYQLRSDGTKLYGAVQVNCDLVIGTNSTGTNVRLWINTNKDSSVYTHFYDINAEAIRAGYNTSLEANAASDIENTSLERAVVGGDGVTYVEFSVDLAEFGGSLEFNYFIQVSNHFESGEHATLLYPAVANGKATFPYSAWQFDNDITVKVSDIILNPEDVEPHQHVAGDEWLSDETGHWHVCACGEVMDKEEHTASSATCTEDGVCSVCGYVVESAHGHTFEDPDCEIDKTCSVCGTEVPASEHVPGDWKTVYPAEIGVPGCEELRCSVCDKVLETRTTPALLPDGAYVIGHIGYSHGNTTDAVIMAGDNMTVAQLTAATYGSEKEPEWWKLVIVNSENVVVKCVGEVKKKTEVCPEGGYLLMAWSGTNWPLYSSFDNISVGDTITLYNVNLDDVRGCTAYYAVEGAGFTVTKHTHSFSEEYTSDETGHWHACSICGEKADFAEHDAGAWETVTEPQIGVEGLEALKCTVCGYKLSERAIDALADNVTIDHMGYYHTGGITLIMAGDGQTVEALTARGNGGASKPMNYFVLIVVDKNNEIVKICDTYGNNKTAENVDKSAVVCPEGGYIIAIHGNFIDDGTRGTRVVIDETSGAEIYRAEGLPEVGETIILTGVDLESLQTLEGHEALENATYAVSTHVHRPGDELCSDETGHWYECSCGEVMGFEAHDEGAWTTVTEMAIGTDGLEQRCCTVCGYVLESKTIPAWVQSDYVTGWNAERQGLHGMTTVDSVILTETIEGTAATFTWWKHVSFAPVEGEENTFEVVAIKPDGTAEYLEVPEGGFVWIVYTYGGSNENAKNLINSLAVGNKVVLSGIDLENCTNTADAKMEIVIEVDPTNISLGKPYTTSPLYQQGGESVQWGWDDDAAVRYPDEGGISLTDGIYFTGNSYIDVSLAGFSGGNADSPTPGYNERGYHYINVDLGDLYTIDSMCVQGANVNLGYGVSTLNVEFYVSVDGETYTYIGSATSSATECYDDYKIEITTAGRYVEARFKNFAMVAEIEVHGSLHTEHNIVYESDADGHTAHCACGQLNGEKENHVSSGEATCTEDSICTVCGYVIKAAHHVPGTLEVVTPAGETTAGVGVIKCTVCGEILETKDIPAENEAITVDGNLSDNAWLLNSWISVDATNGTYQGAPTTDDSVSFKYQMRTDGEKVYVAVIADNELVVGGNGVGTNVRLWIRSGNDEALWYTHLYDVNAVEDGCTGRYKSPENNVTGKQWVSELIENTSLVAAYGEGEGQCWFEFSIDISEFGGESGFSYYISVSNNVNENLCLYYPEISGSAELPYASWIVTKDIDVDPSTLLLNGDPSLVNPVLPEPLPDDAIQLMYAPCNYVSSPITFIMAGDNMTVGELTAITAGAAKDLNYWYVYVVGADNKVVGVHEVLGRENEGGVKTDVVCPEGGYIIAVQGGCDKPTIGLGDTITLYNVDLDEVRALTEVKELENAGFTVTPEIEEITVDGVLEDNGWVESAWTVVDPSNATYQGAPTTDDSVSFKYQMRADGEKIYVAVIADNELVVGGNGVGTNVRLWIRSGNDEALWYTHLYDVNAVEDGCTGRYKSPENNVTGKQWASELMENTSLVAAYGEGEGQCWFEFSIDISEFGGESGFSYYISVSNNVNENLCLYYPAISGSAELPYASWMVTKDIDVDLASITLNSGIVPVPAVPVAPVVLGVESYTCDLTKSYTDDYLIDDGVKLTDGVKGTASNWSSAYSAWNYGETGITHDFYLTLSGESELASVIVYCYGGAGGVTVPKGITVSYSVDGENYIDVAPASSYASSGNATVVDEENHLVQCKAEINGLTAKYVKVSFELWPWGTGAIFIDEIEVYGFAS